MIGAAEALGLLVEGAAPLEVEELPLARVRGRVLAETLLADRDFPPTDRSAMDGFAVRSADLVEPGRTLRVAGEIRAGQSADGVRVAPGEAVRIMTGAIVPRGADAVVMVERTREDRATARVTIDDAPSAGQHVRRRGEERRAGDPVLEPGTPIGPAEIAALAAVGRARVRVHRQPVASVLTTGDEVVEPGRPAALHQVRNSNGPMLLALLAELGLDGRDLGIARDEPDELRERIERGLHDDLLLVTGGVSAGDYDRVGESLAAAGVRRLFHGVSMKPGRPILAGARGSCRVIGLPGNPVSAHAGFRIFAAPLLRRMMGCRRWADVEVQVRLAAPLRARPGRETFHLARFEPGRDALSAWPVASAGSGDVLALARAEGFVITPADSAGLERGATARALLWPRR